MRGGGVDAATLVAALGAGPPETKKHSSNTDARANNTLHVTRLPQTGAC